MLRKTIDNIRKMSANGAITKWDGITEAEDTLLKNLIEKALKMAFVYKEPVDSVVDKMRLLETRKRHYIKASRIARKSKRPLTKAEIKEHSNILMDKLQMMMRDYYKRIADNLKGSQLVDKSAIPSIVFNEMHDFGEALSRTLVGEVENIYRKSYHSIGDKFANHSK